MSRVLALGLAVCLALGGAGCTGCPTALLEGVLVADGQGGLAVQADDGAVVPVEWPDGVGVGRDGDTLVLTGRLGLPIAHEGEFVSLGGGSAMEGPGFVACGPITVRTAAPPTK